MLLLFLLLLFFGTAQLVVQCEKKKGGEEHPTTTTRTLSSMEKIGKQLIDFGQYENPKKAKANNNNVINNNDDVNVDTKMMSKKDNGQRSSSSSSPYVASYCFASYNANGPMEDRVDVLLSSSSDDKNDNSFFSSGGLENDVQKMDYFAVFDGHGGWQVSDYAKSSLIPNTVKEMNAMVKKCEDEQVCEVEAIPKAITRAFERTDRDLLTQVRQSFAMGFGQVARVGSCALLVHIQQATLFVANAGDCRVVMGSSNGVLEENKAKELKTTALSFDHNARIASEQERLAKEHPGEEDIIKCKSPTACYVKGRLQPTRSFGDFYLKHSEFNGPEYQNGDRSRGRHVPSPYTPPYITATPEITTHVISKDDQFLIIGSDGLWDFLENEEAVGIVQLAMKSKTPELASEMILEQVLLRAAERSRLTLDELLALPAGRARRSRHDDTTVAVIYLLRDRQ